MPIRYKLLVPLLAIVAMAMLVIEETGFVNARWALERRIASQLLLVASAKKARVVEALEAKDRLTAAFASDGLIREELERLVRIPAGEQRRRASRRLTYHLAVNKAPVLDKAEVFVLDEHGTVVASSTDVPPGAELLATGPRPPAAVRYLRAGDGRTGSLQFGAQLLSVDRQRAIGFVVVTHDLAVQRPLLPEDTEDVQTYLLDEGGRLIGEAPDPRGSGPWTIPDIGDLRTPDSTVLRRAGATGRPVLATHDRIAFGSQEWLLVVEMDEENAFADIDRLRRSLLIISGIVFVLMWLTVDILARAIAVPLLALAEGADKIRAGDLSHEVATDDRDEVGQLSRAVDAMARRLGAKVEELRRSNEELERFVYVASHDLQEPLRKVQAFASRLARQTAGGLAEPAQDSLRRILNSAGRMRKLIDDLLVFSRVRSRAAKRVSVDLAGIVAAVASDLEASIDETGAQIECGDLPTIEADPPQMRQLFRNLIDNGIKFRRGETPPRVEVTAAPLDDGADRPPDVSASEPLYRIVVKDNGIGFDQKHGDRVFGAFRRLHGSEIAGTGIGLAVCRRIVEYHRGTIGVISEAGRGTEVVVVLPLHQQLDGIATS